MGYYKIAPNPGNPRMFDVHYWTPAKGAPLPANTIRTPIGWVEKLNDAPLIKREAEEMIEDHKARLRRADIVRAIVDAIYGACDNGCDMYELDNDYVDQYAVGSVAMEISYRDKSELPVGDDYMDAGGYVSQHMEYRRMEGLPTYSRDDLRPHLGAGILAFIDDPGRRE